MTSMTGAESAEFERGVPLGSFYIYCLYETRDGFDGMPILLSLRKDLYKGDGFELLTLRSAKRYKKSFSVFYLL